MDSLPRTIAISGASGLVGQALRDLLTDRGDRVRPLVRGSESSPEDIPWQPGEAVDQRHWEGVDALVHLAGENIASGRWNAERKRRLVKSRVDATRALCEGLAAAPVRPRSLLCASAIGIYGDRGDEILKETSAPGEGFLAELAQDWEAACDPARAVGIRVVNLRFGIILARKGGALSKMLTPFRLGLGGRVGSGHQYWSWVSLHDVVRAIQFAIERDDLHGPINVVSPTCPTNRQFTEALGRTLHRPTVLPLPAFAAKLAMGSEMAQGLLLASARVEPTALLESGFSFDHPTLAQAFGAILS